MLNTICFGEVLWDVFPTKKIAGGAPMNVAIHLANMGLNVSMMSRIGTDELSDELLEFMAKRQVNTDFIQKDSELPTGIVNVEIDEGGLPTYEIVEPVAWDNIQYAEQQIEAVKNCDAFVFGTLAMRNEFTRNALFELLPHATLRVLDVNFRQNYYSQQSVERLFKFAHIIKLNDEELDVICDWYNYEDTNEGKAFFIYKKFNINTLIITKGKGGAEVIHDNEMSSCVALNISVKDTVGSGDAFLAGFLFKKLNDASINECLEFANACGALVATFEGGTPSINPKMVYDMIRISTPI
mgnify:CR=1 FL=1